VAKVKVVGRNNLDGNLNGEAFKNTTSETIFKFGSFTLTSNFDGRTYIDYSNKLSTFVRPIDLDSLNLTNVESENIFYTTQNAVLNLDRSDINTFVRFGSAYEFLRVAVENIILKYPNSLFVNSQISRGGNVTIYDYNYDIIHNKSTFKIPSQFTVNKGGLVFNYGNTSLPDDNELKNLNLSYNNYVVWSSENFDNNSHLIIGFTGDTNSRTNLIVECLGNPFPTISGSSTTGSIDVHLKPTNRIFDDFRLTLDDFQRNMMSTRIGPDGFEFILKEPILLDDGKINYKNKKIVWITSDNYNIDIDTPQYNAFLNTVLDIGNKYDQIKTDLIARFLSPASLQTYDLTDEKKMVKLMRIYGAEFDQLREFIDSLVYINRITYDKKKNLPDQIVSNLASVFGWDYFQLVNEGELVESILDATGPERNLETDLTPAEVDIELWRRILINTNYYWKSKGTREGLKSIFTLIGIPEPFINITEYVYTVDGRIDPRNVTLTLDDLPSASLPYDSNGYPIAPVETPDFYFQVSGDSDSGQAYMDNFRNVGFDLLIHIDNKKSWTQTGATYRDHYSSPQYYQLDNQLVLNTKEVDISLDTSRGVEYDVWNYITDIDFPANSSGYTLPFVFVNLSLDVANPQQNEFILPDSPEGDVEVRFNGLLLVGPKTWDGSIVESGNTMTDYYFTSEKTFKLGSAVYGDQYARNDGNNRDVIEATYVFKQGTGFAHITVKYIVLTIKPTALGAIIPLPDTPDGDVQLTINGIAATKGTSQFVADYIVSGDQIVIQNPDVIAYFTTNPWTQVAYITVTGSTEINARQEVIRVDSFYSGKFYFDANANKAVLRLNYKMTNAESVKILIDGIALEPGTDYIINPNNAYEVYLPPGINLGTIICAHYLIGGNDLFNSIIDGGFGLGDVSNLSFLEFIELIQRKLINATNRKTITDFKGGWYPTLYKIYTTYLHRSNLPDGDPLKSNGYTFENLYPFLNKYNAFFQRFVDQLLSTTIIQRKGGLLIRNTIFTKQKFTHKRGVSFDTSLKYLGDDGSTFLKRPLTVFANWTNDAVCNFDFCTYFEVTDIHVQFPVTTTTTTAFPYNGVLNLNEYEALITPIPNGQYQVTKYRLELSPALLPGYEVEFDMNFIFNGVNSGTTGSGESIGIVSIRKNSLTIYTNTETITGDNSGTTIFDTQIIGGVGDVIEVTLENVATATSGSAYGELIFQPTVPIITPNGQVPLVIPTLVENYAQTP
jgi:hypothetical protein